MCPLAHEPRHLPIWAPPCSLSLPSRARGQLRITPEKPPRSRKTNAWKGRAAEGAPLLVYVNGGDQWVCFPKTLRRPEITHPVKTLSLKQNGTISHPRPDPHGLWDSAPSCICRGQTQTGIKDHQMTTKPGQKYTPIN